MTTTIITEKPSVAREIAAIVGATERRDGYIRGNGYIVTWAIGHLVNLAMPEEYGAKGFRRENLPIVPKAFVLQPRRIKAEKGYKPDTGVLKQLRVIRESFNECDRIIVATDAGREGELIFRYIYSFLNCQKPFDRLWISSLTDKAIKKGMQQLKKGGDYDKLYFAAKARSEADWLVGINATQALSIAAGQGVFSLGRVQTPTLSMICKRYLENRDFVSIPYWQLQLQTVKGNTTFTAILNEKFECYERAVEILRRIERCNTVYVHSVDKKLINQQPPLLFDLTTLQKEANIKYDFSADKTLTIAQKLYESKLITYPRTGSRYLTDDVFESIPKLLVCLHSHQQFGEYAAGLSSLNKRSVNGKKVTDHHAIIITENHASDLPNDERKIYDMIAGRILESFSLKSIKKVTTVIFSCADIQFEAKGSELHQAGWKSVWNDKDEKEDNKLLPILIKGEKLPIDEVVLQEKKTNPKPIHTEATLLSAMENAGKEVDDVEERDAMKESGIGTPATRAAIMETLFARDYIQRKKKSLVPTEKGLAVFEAVKNKLIADVAMTGNWENSLTKIESGNLSAETFKNGIEDYTRQVTKELLDCQFPFSEENNYTCPKCKTGKVIFYPKVVKCNKPDCGFLIFRTISEKKLTDAQIGALLKLGKTPVIKGFKSKKGKLFNVVLAINEQYKTVFVFPEKKYSNYKRK